MVDQVHKDQYNTESARQSSSGLKGLSSHCMEMVDSAIISSMLDSPGNAASVDCKMMKTEPRKSIHKEVPSSEVSNLMSSHCMEMVDSVIISSTLDSSGNAASVNCKMMKTEPRKGIYKEVPSSEVSNLTTPCVSLKCNQFCGVQCRNEDSQLNVGKEIEVVCCEHPAVCTNHTGFPALEDIIATGWESSDSDPPETHCSGMNSVRSDLAGAVEIQSVPCDGRCVVLDACQSNSNVVSTGIPGSHSGNTRLNSQITSNGSGWSRKRWISNGFRKFSMDSRESVVSSSSAPVKCSKNKTRHGDISAPNKTSRAKPVGYKNSDFVWNKIGTRAKQGTNAPRGTYMENHSVTETRSTGSSPRNQFSFRQRQLSSKLPYAAHSVRYQTASPYKRSDRIYRTCGQEATMSPLCSFEQDFGTSGVQCLPIPVHSSATGHLAWEGWMYGTYQPYDFDALQPLATPEWYSGSCIDLNPPQWEDSQWNYGHDLYSYGLYHYGFMPEFGFQSPQGIPQPVQTSYVPCDYHEAIFPSEQIMGGTDPLALPSIRGHSTPEETKDSDSSNSTDTKVDETTRSFSGCDTTGGSPETEPGNKMGSISSSVTDSVRNSGAHEHPDGNRNQADPQCTAPGDRFTYVCSQKTAEALAASWKSQVVAESILEATGSPIAQFERLLYATAPVVASSSDKLPDEILCNTPRTTLLNKTLWPDVSLLDVWKWYIDCAGYGIGVKVEDSGKSDCFTAYFSPSLSSVQLFGYSNNSLLESLKKLNVDVPKTVNSGKCLRGPSSPDLKHIGDPSGSDNLSSLLQNDSIEEPIASSSAPSFCFSDDVELIFEYFEHDQPQNRKPLPQTIIEIIEHGSSSPHSFGDPSELDQLKLLNLHPASWYSVAWYPIYRIPENNAAGVPSLRASFLTYHSLSHIVMRHESPYQLGNISWSIPALGMRRYNGNEECWFRPTEFPGQIIINDSPSDGPKVVEQRLRALEEVAAMFSDGHVQKNGVTAANKHPDYDFFTRRT